MAHQALRIKSVNQRDKAPLCLLGVDPGPGLGPGPDNYNYLPWLPAKKHLEALLLALFKDYKWGRG